MRQLRKRAIAYGCLIVLTGLGACSRPEPKSTIVEKVEQAGSGHLATVPEDAMREWLGKHKEVAYQVDEMCKPVRQTATAQWTGSTEDGYALPLTSLLSGALDPLPVTTKRTRRA